MYIYVICLLGVLVLLLSLVIRRKWLEITRVKPVLHYMKSKLNEDMIDSCKSLKNLDFCPQTYITNRHLQTILSSIMYRFRTYGVHYRRELVSMPDGEKVALDWAEAENLDPHPNNEEKDIVLIIPGLTGDSTIFRSTCASLMQAGYRSVVINKRGHGGSILTIPKFNGFADHSDLHNVLKVIKDRYRNSKVAVIGYSAGSAIHNGYIAEYGDSALLDCCLSVSSGYQVKRYFSNPPCHLFYQYAIVKSTKEYILKPNKEILLQKLTQRDIKYCYTLYDIQKIYSKTNDCKTMEDYWTDNQPQWVECFRIPRLFINSLDDPICPAELIPFENFGKFDNAILMTTDLGGHVGFLEGISTHWADKVCVDYIQTVFKKISKQSDEIKPVPD